MDYLGRYTPRVAIPNHRLLDMQGGQVSFSYKDYKNAQQQKVMTLSADEFLRRFLLHVLPDGFRRIRHYGLLGNRHRAENLPFADNWRLSLSRFLSAGLISDNA